MRRSEKTIKSHQKCRLSVIHPKLRSLAIKYSQEKTTEYFRDGWSRIDSKKKVRKVKAIRKIAELESQRVIIS